MSKFNEKLSTSANASHPSYEGGSVFYKSSLNEWLNLLLSSKLQDGYYEDEDTIEGRFLDLTRTVIAISGPEFAAKSAMFARREVGMRSTSELVAAVLNEYKFEQKRSFYSKFFYRPDDVAEVFAAVDMLGGKKSHGLLKGACNYLSTLNAYQLTKYKLISHKYSMYSLIDLTHPKSVYIDDFCNHRLSKPETWEVLISSCRDENDKALRWKYLVDNRKLGYLALIRNLRNIVRSVSSIESDFYSWLESTLCPQVEDNESILKSLVWPYQIYTAYRSFDSEADIPFPLINSLHKAFYSSCKNLPSLPGKTLAVLDVSGSMYYPYTPTLSIVDTCASYLAGFLAADSDLDVVKFGTNCRKFVCPTYRDSNSMDVIYKLTKNDNCGCSTNIVSVFEYLIDNKLSYDSILLFSDMQVMEDWSCVQGFSATRYNFDEYKKTCGKSHIYSFDLGNYSDQIVPKDTDITYLTAINPSAFKLISLGDYENVKAYLESYSL